MVFKVGPTIQRTGPILPSDWLKIAEAMGMEHLEFDMSVFDDIDNVLAVNRKKQVAIHAPYVLDYGIDLSTNKEKVMRFIKNVNDYSEALNSKFVIVHPPDDPDGSMEVFLENISLLEPQVMFENMPWQKWDDFVSLFNRVKDTRKDAGFCFDIPHSFITNGNSFLSVPEILINLLRCDTGYIHFSGGFRGEDTHLPLVTDGEIPFNEVKEFLSSFKGTLTLELAPRSIDDLSKVFKSYKLLLAVSGSKLLRARAFLMEKIIMRKIKSIASDRGVSEVVRQ
ncbi:MAG: TIM barrel protein [Candidatus Hodarchaeales archaeon]